MVMGKRRPTRTTSAGTRIKERDGQAIGEQRKTLNRYVKKKEKKNPQQHFVASGGDGVGIPYLFLEKKEYWRTCNADHGKRRHSKLFRRKQAPA